MIATVYDALTAPSAIGAGPVIASVGVASSSVIVPVPVVSPASAFVGAESVTVNCRSGWSRSFSAVAMS